MSVPKPVLESWSSMFKGDILYQSPHIIHKKDFLVRASVMIDFREMCDIEDKLHLEFTLCVLGVRW